MFQVHMLPATFGDSFWVTYQGDDQHEHRMLIDGGTAATRNRIHKLIRALPDDDRRIDLVVVSHIDKDHIAGILTMLQRKEVHVEIGDLWFNGRKHLADALPTDSSDDLLAAGNISPGGSPDDLLGSKQGEQLTQVIEADRIAWNRAFGGNAVLLPDDGTRPVFTLPGGMKLTLLSPTRQALHNLIDAWDDELRDAGLLQSQTPMMDQDEIEPEGADDDDLLSTVLPDIATLATSDFDRDRSAANGSSIAFLLEHGGRRALFAADAHADVICESIDALEASGTLQVDLVKISHHGSKGTTSRELIEKLRCRRYAITTNGSTFGHPDDETIARILTFGGDNLQLLFNYRSNHNQIWDNPALKDEFGYETEYPPAGADGLTVDV